MCVLFKREKKGLIVLANDVYYLIVLKELSNKTRTKCPPNKIQKCYDPYQAILQLLVRLLSFFLIKR